MMLTGHPGDREKSGATPPSHRMSLPFLDTNASDDFGVSFLNSNIRGHWPLLRLAKMDPTIMKTTFRFGLPRQIAGLLLLWCYLALSDGRGADAVVLLPKGSAPEAIVSAARLSLAEARRTGS